MVTSVILDLIWLLQNHLAFVFMNHVIHLLQSKVREVLEALVLHSEVLNAWKLKLTKNSPSRCYSAKRQRYREKT